LGVGFGVTFDGFGGRFWGSVLGSLLTVLDGFGVTFDGFGVTFDGFGVTFDGFGRFWGHF